MASEGRSSWPNDHLTKLLKYPSFANPTVQYRKGRIYQQHL